MKQSNNGTIEFRSDSGETLWAFMPLRYWDSSETPKEGVADFIIKDNVLSIRVPYSWLQSATYPVYIDTTIDVQVRTGTDDGGYYTYHVWSQTANNLDVGNYYYYAEYSDSSYYRFASVTIPAGSTITSSYISLNYSNTYGNPLTKVSADDQATPAAPSSGADQDGRTRTTNKVDWDGGLVPGWNNSPSLNAVIQELVNSYDYSGGAPIQILHDNDGSASGDNWLEGRAYEWSTASAPILHIEYTAAAGWQPRPPGISPSGGGFLMF